MLVTKCETKNATTVQWKPKRLDLSQEFRSQCLTSKLLLTQPILKQQLSMDYSKQFFFFLHNIKARQWQLTLKTLNIQEEPLF